MRLALLALLMLLPAAAGEVGHAPTEVSEGASFTAWFDADENVTRVSFYACTLREPFTCELPQRMNRENASDGRFSFTRPVTPDERPGYRFVLDHADGNRTRVPVNSTAIYPELEVTEQGDSGRYYFRVLVTQGVHRVSVENLSFTPAELVLPVGDTVRWSWSGDAEHNVVQVADADDGARVAGGFASGDANQSGELTYTFDEPGVYHYLCETHAGGGMQGQIVMEARATPAATSEDAPGPGALVAGLAVAAAARVRRGDRHG